MSYEVPENVYSQPVQPQPVQPQRSSGIAPSLVLAIAALVASGLSSILVHFVQYSGGLGVVENFMLVSAVTSIITSLIALAALIVGFISLTRGTTARASAGAAVGIGGLIVSGSLIFYLMTAVMAFR